MKSLLTVFVIALTTPQLPEKPALTKEEIYKVFSNFLGGRWETKGKWNTGAAFHQEIIVETGLTGNIFTVKTHDYVDSRQFDNAQRNYGIRAWDDREKKMKFWEFDVFGGIISGEVIIDGNDIYLVYPYTNKKGETRTMADAWIFVDKDTYLYKVCEFTDGKPGKEYMSSTYKRKP